MKLSTRGGLKGFTKILSTWFGCGFFIKIPGTIGSLASLPLAYVIFLSNITFGLLLIFILFVLGCFCVDQYIRCVGGDDPKEVVIDEVVGQLLTMWLVIVGIRFGLGTTLVYYEFIKLFFLSFVFFRLFDVLKIWPISFIDQNVKGFLGVMLDDILASVFAAAVSIIVISFL